MKFINLLTIACGSFLLLSCEPENFGPVIKETTDNNIAALSGTWKITSAKQTDEEASLKNSPYVSSIITNDFPYTEFQLSLESQGGLPTGFATTPGNAPRVIPFASGKWEVDNPEAPSQVAFINGTDTMRAVLGAYPSAFRSSFILKIPRVNAESGKTTMMYEYQFTKQ
ncbi:DUF5004 domain-containing protein [Flavihumibacter sp. CACIAM 22H1]|uniref:DUF5004 domain-containing protein n=1 Tax=Flavihumibacter sp. CACIAM 22H1 TaxID=1812911 RepID=UPI0007A8B97A|nr:DUF5004 domain-containing protein [Flavihumibacter sp. CACIAM 22H1]KYP13598.1 MAG: hypothetical protein A1D16_00910 [Flavihumibacter sp. CACIAM 22H1]